MKYNEPDLNRLLAALLAPTVTMMRSAGIARMACDHEKGFVLQMEDGTVIEIPTPNVR